MHGMKCWLGKTVWQNHSTRTIERETLPKGVNVLLLFYVLTMLGWRNIGKSMDNCFALCGRLS